MYFNQFAYDNAEPGIDWIGDAMEAEGLDPADPQARAAFISEIEEDQADAAIYQWELNQ